jgi:DNA (cytosine-5)-methyltransferase 1
MKTKVKIVDLFAGVGGLSYAFAQDLDFEIIAANEILPNMAKAYKLNHPSVKVYCKDIVQFGLNDLNKDFSISKGSIDIVIGGPPCQAYSTVGKRLIDDPRGKLFQEYFRILKELDPSIFIFENVKGLISMGDGFLLPTIIDLFSTLGYTTQFKTLNAADYGAPQMRERVIIVGSKRGIKYKFPNQTHGINADLFNNKTSPHLTLKEALSDLPLNPNEDVNFYMTEPQNEFQKLMRMNASDKITEHTVPKNNPTLIKIMELLPEGGTPKDLPIDIRPSSGFGNSYSRLWWNRPSTTLTRNFSTPSSARCIHPLVARPLSTREGARIQGFPDNYIFCGSRSEKNLQIGNAVSPFLSKALLSSIKKCIF